MHIDTAHTKASRERRPATREFTAREITVLVNAIQTAYHYAPEMRSNPDLSAILNEGWEVAE